MYGMVKLEDEMKIYKFFDSDNTGFIEYDIAGKEYVDLIKTCFRYCKTVSFRVCSERVILPKEIEPYRIAITHNMLDVYSHYYNCISLEMEKEVRHYILSPVVQEMVLNTTDSIFKWIDGWGHKNPEDPAFYRGDGSVFFSSVIHEGECMLTPISTENINHIISCVYEGVNEKNDAVSENSNKGAMYGYWEEVNHRFEKSRWLIKD